MNRFLCRIEFSGQQYVSRGEVRNSLRVFDYPDSSVIIGNKDGSLGFPFRVSYRSASAPTFLHAIRTPSFRVFGPTSFVADPSCPRCVLLLCPKRAERHETANEQENKSNPTFNHVSTFWLGHAYRKLRNIYHDADNCSLLELHLIDGITLIGNLMPKYDSEDEGRASQCGN